MRKLQVDTERAHGEKAERRSVMEAENQEIVKAQADISEVEATKAALEQRVGAMESMLEDEKSEYASLGQSLTEAEEHTDHRVELLQRGLHAFLRLGLSFERVGADRLRLVFTLIDPCDTERPFAFDVFINPDEKYEVTGCAPLLPCLDELIEELNTSNAFSTFVQNMRGAFKELVEEEGVAGGEAASGSRAGGQGTPIVGFR